MGTVLCFTGVLLHSYYEMSERVGTNGADLSCLFLPGCLIQTGFGSKDNFRGNVTS